MSWGQYRPRVGSDLVAVRTIREGATRVLPGPALSLQYLCIVSVIIERGSSKVSLEPPKVKSDLVVSTTVPMYQGGRRGINFFRSLVYSSKS